MDENINNNPERISQQNNAEQTSDAENEEGQQVNPTMLRFGMDERGHIRSSRGGAAAIPADARTYVILGWISVALTLLIHPFFAMGGIIFGLLANAKERGRGTPIIITSIVFAALYLLLSLFLLDALRWVMPGTPWY